MVGVSGPMFAESAAQGRRFMIGLTLGSLAGGVILATAAAVVGIGLARTGLPLGARLVMLIGVALILGLADLANRTPQWFRQVPQRLVRELSPGTLGVVYGVDLGLIVTTKKVTSLWWLAIAGLALVSPVLLVIAVPVGAVATSLAVWSWSLRIKGDTACLFRKNQRNWITQLRLMSGTAMIVAAGLFAVLLVGHPLT
jgi:hypothetical protein